MKGLKIIALTSFILLLAFAFFYSKTKIFAQNQDRIELYALSDPWATKIEKIESTQISDIYQTSFNSVVASGTLFRMILKNGSVGNQTIYLTFKEGNIITAATSGPCTSTGGYTSGTDCILEGIFTGNGYYTIEYKRGTNQTSSFSFFVVDLNRRDKHFWIIPTTTFATPTSNVQYTIYLNKSYCPTDPNKEFPATSTSIVNPRPPRGIIPTIVLENKLISSGTLYLGIGLALNNVATGTYNLYLASGTTPVSNTTTLIVNLTGRGEQIQYRCFMGLCQYYNTTTRMWFTTSTQNCKNVGLDCTAPIIRE